MGDDFINVKGGRVWFRAAGKERKKTPLLVLHGGPGGSWDYLQPLEALADERPVIFYDQLGCGNSDRPSDKSLWTLARYVDELETIVRELGLSSFHLLGNSWGCMLGIEYMLEKRPKEPASLIFSAPCLSAGRWHEDQRRYIAALPEKERMIIEKAEAQSSFGPEYEQAMMVFYKRHLCRLDPWPEVLNRTFAKLNRDIYLHMWGPSEFTITGALKGFERAQRLAEVKIPALFTCGRYDEASPETVEYYRRMMPGSKIRIFEGCSHSHHLEDTRGYIEAVRNFLPEK
ncbi:MAG: proline iminopeptidase-family hydrolase [Candidatus Omnitrophica bacterium]|nr:proline iminopeptidase-family hydrolase [Candidatus Omnitrophota bacterium]